MKPDGYYYAQEEVLAIFDQLSDADVLRLKALARIQGAKIPNSDHDNLFAEGITRVLDGTRQWPRGLEIGPFMRNVYGSLTTAEAKHRELVGAVLVDTEVDRSGDVVEIENPGSGGPQSDISDQLHARDMLQKINDALVDDPTALAVCISLAEGLSANEAQHRFNISSLDYQAARKRMQRKVLSVIAKEETI